jgi:hypothetical protein
MVPVGVPPGPVTERSGATSTELVQYDTATNPEPAAALPPITDTAVG